MKTFIYTSFVILFLFSFSSCNSTKTNSSETDIIGIWYPRNPISNYRVRINEKLFITEGMRYTKEIEVTETTPKEIIEKIGKWKIQDTIKIIEKEFIRNSTNQAAISLIMSRKKNGEIQYNFFLLTQTEIKGIMTIFSAVNGGFETIGEAKNAMKEAKFQNVNQEFFFSEKYVKTIFPTLKPMEEITKQDYITTVKYVRSFENELKEFIIEKFGKKDEYISYEMKEIAQKLAYKKLYFLGYDPNNLPEDGNYLKKFEGDKDIEELNKIESEIKF